MVIAGEKDLSRKKKPAHVGLQSKPADAELEPGRYRKILDTAVRLAGSEFIKPLSSIKGYLGLLASSERQENPESGREHYLCRAEEAVQELEDLLHLYMQLLRSGDGKVEPGDVRSIEVRDFIDEVIEKSCPECGAIENGVDEGMARISVQKKPLMTALVNIFSAAVRSDCASGATVASRTWAEEGESGKGFLIIDLICPSANGSGKKGSGVFEPADAETVGSTARPEEPGVLLARNIIEILGGKVEENYLRGTGTTITMTIPAVVAS